MYAVKNGHTALVKCILDRGVEILVTNVVRNYCMQQEM